MLITLEKLFNHSKCYPSYNILSYNARIALNITSEKYDENKVKLTSSTKGTKGSNQFVQYAIKIDFSHS